MKLHRFYPIVLLVIFNSCEKSKAKKQERTEVSSYHAVTDSPAVNLKDSALIRQKTKLSVKKQFDWFGNYACNFLRMKEESGDPRGWGMIYINLKRESATFKLESYIEQISEELIILNHNESEIILSLKNQKDSTFIIHKKENKYFLKSNYIEKVVGEKENYLLIKK